jgi:hypothetical protein
LREVGAVETGRCDPDEDLTGACPGPLDFDEAGPVAVRDSLDLQTLQRGLPGCRAASLHPRDAVHGRALAGFAPEHGGPPFPPGRAILPHALEEGMRLGKLRPIDSLYVRS